MINVDLSKLKEIISSDLRLAGNIIQAIINFLSRNSFSSDFSSDINNILEKYKEVQRISSEASKSISDAISIIGGIEKGNVNSIRDIVRDTNSNRPTKTNTRSSNKADNIEYLGDTTSEPEEKSSVDVKKENTTNDVKVENVSKTTKEIDKTTNIETVKPTDTSSSNQVSKTEETTKAVETNDLVTVADNILKVDSVDNSKTGANETKELSDENSSFMDRIINWLKKAWSELRYKFKSKTKETQQIRSEFTKEINNVSDRNSQVYENYVNNAFFQNMPKFESTLKDLGIEDWQLIDDDTRSKYEKYEKDLLDLLNEFNNLGGNFALASDNIDEETRAKLNKLQNEIQTLSEERNKFINDTIEDVMRDVSDAGLSLAERIKKLDKEREELDGSLNEYSMSSETIKHYGEECERINAEKNDLQKKLDAYTAFKAEYMGQLKQINFSSKSATYSLSALEGFNYTEAEISEYMENVYKNSGSELSYETWKAFNQEACVEQFLIEKGNEWRIEKYGSLDYLSSNPNIFVQVDEMEAGEIAMYNYLHEMVSVKAADDYLSFLEDELNRRKGEAKALEFLNSLKNNNVDYVRTAGEGVKNGLQNFLKGYHNLVFADSVVDVDDYENMYIIEALSGDGYKYGLDFTYSNASSIGNMLIPATLSTVVTALKGKEVGGLVGNVAMSLSIFGNTMDQSLEEGKTVESSFKYSAFSTATESVTSLFLSGVGFSIFEQKFGLLGNVVSEVTEEELQLLLDKGYKAIAEGDTEAFNNLKEEMGDTLTQTIVSTIILNGYNKATSTVTGAAMGGIASVKGKRANSVQPNSKIIDKAGASSDVSEAFRIDYDAKSNKYDFVSPDGKKVLDSVNDVQTGDVYVSPNVQKAMNDVKGIESDVNSKVASENKNNSNLSDIEMLDAIDKSSKARKSEFYKDDISSNSASQKALEDVKQIQKEVSSGSKNKTTDVTSNNTQTEAQRLREVEALRLKDGETFDVNKYDLNELETIRKNNPGVDLKIDADNNRIVASKNERYTYDVEFAEAKNSVKAKGAEAVQQIIDEVGEIDANKSFSDIAKESQKNGKTSNSRDVYSDSHAQQIMDEIANVREDIKNKGAEDAKKIFDDIANIDANKSFEDIAKEAQNKKTTKNKRRIDEYWVLFDDKDTSSSNKPGGKTGTNSDVSEAFKIDYDAKSNKYDFVSPDGKKVLDSVNDVQTGDVYVSPNVQKAMNDVKGIESDVNSKVASENKNNSNLSDIEMLDAIDKSSKARKSEFYKDDISSNSASQKALEDVKQIQKEVSSGSKNKTTDVTSNNTQTEAQRLREVEALRLKDGETFDVNKYDLNELETIRKNNPGVDLKIDADNNRIVASKNERYTYDVEFAEAKNSVKAKGAEAVQQIIDEVGEIDANKSFSDIAKESQKNGKASNSRDVYSDSHAQQIMDEIANVREDIKNKGTEDAKKIFDDIANIDANKSFSDIAKEAQKNGKTSNSRDVYSDSHVQQALEDLANIRKEVNAKFKKSSDSSSIKKTSSTMVNNFDNQMGIFENVGEVTSAGVLGASLLQGMNSDSTNISLRERFWAVNEFQNAFKTGANSNGELIELLSLGFNEAMYSGNKDALGIMKMLTDLKTLNPNLTIEVDANNGNYWSWDDSTLVIGSNTLESKNLDTVYHELGHCLFDSLMGGEVPENFSHAIDSAKYIYHDSPFSEFFTKTLKGLEYSTRVEANIAYENNLKQSLGISIDERVKTLSENYTNFFGHMNVDEINSVLNEYGMDFEDFLYNYSGSLIDLAHDLAVVEIRNQELAIQDKIFRAKYGAYASLSDMVDAVHSGSDYGINGEHIYKFYQHGETYYKQESNFQFHELIADFTSLKLTGSTEALNYVKGMFGDELYNILDSTYKKFIYND